MTGPKCGTPTGRDWHRRRDEKPCEPCRHAWNEVSRERQARLRASGWVPPSKAKRRKPPTPCSVCGLPMPRSWATEPVHRECRSVRDARQARRSAALRRLTKAAAGTAGSWVWVTGECAQCLTYFVRHGATSRFCSTACSRKARPSKRQFKISTRNRLAIYERDNWICQLCLEAVDGELMTTDPRNDWAPSLDHIEPQSHTLIPDHSPENLRLAHRWCNSVRGDLTYYTDADLRVA